MADTEFIVMTATCRGVGRYKRVAVCQVTKGTVPKQLSMRSRGMVSIARDYGRVRVGTTAACAYARAMREASDLAAALSFIVGCYEHGVIPHASPTGGPVKVYALRNVPSSGRHPAAT